VAAPVDSQQAQIQHLLHEGRARIHAGDIGGALKCAVAALEAAGGQHMVLPSLREAMRKWHEGTVAAADVSDLSSLLAAISLDPPQFAATAEAPAVPRTDGRAERAHSSPQASPILAGTGGSGGGAEGTLQALLPASAAAGAPSTPVPLGTASDRGRGRRRRQGGRRLRTWR